jgi:hypothetical protein
MTEPSEDTELEVEAVEAPADEAEPQQDSALAAFAALEAKRGLGLKDEDEYAAKDSDEADADEDDAIDAGGPGESAATAVEETGQADPAEREAAIRALRRAKTPQSVMDSMSDSDLVEWGLELAKIQSEVDKKLSANRAEPGEDGSDAASEPDTTQQAQPVVTGALDWDQMTAPLKDTFGSDDAEAMVAPMRAVFDTLAQQNQMLQGAVENLLVRESFRGLEGKYPQLAEPDQREAVTAKVRSLNTAEYQSVDDLIADAARLVLGNPRDAEKERRSTVSRKRSASQTRSSNRKVAAQPASDYDNGYESFKALEEKYGLS